MKFPRACLALLSLLAAAPTLLTAHPLLLCDSGNNRVCVVSAEGKIEWEHPALHPQDCWLTPAGNYLFCFKTGALEMTPGHAKVWEYVAPTNSEVHACQPLPEGRVMLVECGTSRIIEVDRAGKILKEIRLHTSPKIGLHDQFRGTRKLPNGHYLVCFKGEHKVVELNSSGGVLREIPTPGDVHEALSLPDGHLLITCGDGHKVIELDAAEKIVWELNENDLPGHPLRLMAGCQRLPNGNTVFVNYLGHGHLGEQPSVFELTRNKQIVWSLNDTNTFKAVSQIQLLDIPGDTTKGEILR
jgi:hypothetical protein